MLKRSFPLNIWHQGLALIIVLIVIPVVYGQSWDIHSFPKASDDEAEIVSVDLSHDALTLKFYPNAQIDQFKIVTCYVDNSSVIAEGENEIGIKQLKPGMRVSSDGAIYKQSVRSCEGLKVLGSGNEAAP